MNFIEVQKNNLELAYEIQKKIFPDSPDALHMKMSVLENVPYFKFWIVYSNSTPIGISGIYTVNCDPESIWLNWFGILPNFRRQGFGKKMLLKTIEKCLELEYFRYFRLHTSEYYNPNAIPLYNEVMDIKESYNNKKDENFNNTALVYSLSLDGTPVTLWDDRYMEIKELEKIAVTGEKLLENNYTNFFSSF